MNRQKYAGLISSTASFWLYSIFLHLHLYVAFSPMEPFIQQKVWTVLFYWQLQLLLSAKIIFLKKSCWSKQYCMRYSASLSSVTYFINIPLALLYSQNRSCGFSNDFKMERWIFPKFNVIASVSSSTSGGFNVERYFKSLVVRIINLFPNTNRQNHKKNLSRLYGIN